jgi:hypothetical protein
MHNHYGTTSFARSQKTVFAALALVTVTAAGRAELLFYNGIAASMVDDLGYNDETVPQRVFEEFSFSTDVHVNAISFVGGYYPANTPQTDSFHVVFLNDLSALPDRNSPVADVALPSVSRSSSGFTYPPSSLYNYSAAFPSVSFDANKTYWLADRNTTTNDPDDDWVWAGRHNTGVAALAGPPDDQFSLIPGGFAFTLAGEPIPEPAAVACAVGSLIPMWRTRRRVPRRYSPIIPR